MKIKEFLPLGAICASTNPLEENLDIEADNTGSGIHVTLTNRF